MSGGMGKKLASANDISANHNPDSFRSASDRVHSYILSGDLVFLSHAKSLKGLAKSGEIGQFTKFTGIIQAIPNHKLIGMENPIQSALNPFKRCSGLSRKTQVLIDFGLRARICSQANCIVFPVSKISSTNTTCIPDKSDFKLPRSWGADCVEVEFP